MLGESTICTTIAVNDLERASDFYEKTLGLRRIDENPGGIMYQSGAGKVFVYQSSTAGSSQATSALWMVDDVAATVSKLQAAGITFEQYDIPGAEVDDVIYSMGTQKTAWFKDPDGNILSVSS